MSDKPDGSFPPELVAMSQALLDSDSIGTEGEQTIEVKPESPPTPETAKPEDGSEAKEGDQAGKTDGSLKDADKSEEKPKSKFAQEQERRAKSWQEINAKKEAFDRERTEFNKQRETEARQRSLNTAFKDEHGYTAEQYQNFSKESRAKGDNEMALAAEKRAMEVGQMEQSARFNALQESHNAKWHESYVELATKNPDLNDKNSAMYKEVAGYIRDWPQLTQFADGLKYAVEATRLTKLSKESQSVSAENDKLKEEIKSLQKKLAPSSGVAAEPPKGATPFDKLSDTEQRTQLEKMLTETPEW